MGTTNLSSAPVALQQGNYSAIDLRRMVTTMLGEGIVASGDFAVTQRAAGANMSVDVAAGQAYVKGDTATDQGHYFVRSSAVVNVPITAADASNPRIDRVVLEIKDDAHDLSGLNVARIRTIDGTPTSGATLTNLNGAAAVPGNCMLLQNRLVPAGSTTATTANGQDRRTGVPIPGKELFGGVATLTANSSGPDAMSVSVIGDGVTPVRVELDAQYLQTAAVAGTGVFARIRDGAAGTGTVHAEALTTSPAPGYGFNARIAARVAAFSGAKTFYYNITVGASTVTLGANAAAPATLRATWAG